MSRIYHKDITDRRDHTLRLWSSLRAITAKGMAVALLLSFSIAPLSLLCSCGHDEPAAEHDNPHRPGNENQGDQPPEEVSPIVGVWSNADGTEIRSFDADGTYHADMPDGETHDGSYVYDDFKRWLYLSLTSTTEIKSVEYRCIIDGDRMTLYDRASRETILTRR